MNQLMGNGTEVGEYNILGRQITSCDNIIHGPIVAPISLCCLPWMHEEHRNATGELKSKNIEHVLDVIVHHLQGTSAHRRVR